MARGGRWEMESWGRRCALGSPCPAAGHSPGAAMGAPHPGVPSPQLPPPPPGSGVLAAESPIPQPPEPCAVPTPRPARSCPAEPPCRPGRSGGRSGAGGHGAVYCDCSRGAARGHPGLSRAELGVPRPAQPQGSSRPAPRPHPAGDSGALGWSGGWGVRVSREGGGALFWEAPERGTGGAGSVRGRQSGVHAWGGPAGGVQLRGIQALVLGDLRGSSSGVPGC